MPREWVLDTCVLKSAEDPSNPNSLDALELILKIKQSHRIGLDHGRAILTEYSRNIRGDSHVGRWLSVIAARSSKIMWRTGRVYSGNREILVERLAFDQDDLVFVGVAFEADKLLVSIDSDYTAEVKSYLLEEMGVRVVDIQEALQIASED